MDGTGQRKLTDHAAGQPDRPDWSPDGFKLLYGLWNVPQGEIFVVDLGDGTSTNLTEDTDETVWFPSWSPDGQKIVYISNATSLAMMDADGSDHVAFFPSFESPRNPDWQPTCTVSGTSQADTLTGTSGSDLICGRGGDDSIYGVGGNDVIFGGGGADSIWGGLGSDIINGGGGGDLIVGGPGSDLLASGIGKVRDHLRGGDGADRLDARDGSGGDRLDGGIGPDLCRADRSDMRISCA